MFTQNSKFKFAFCGIQVCIERIKSAFREIKFSFRGIKFAFCGIKFAPKESSVRFVESSLRFVEFKFASKESSLRKRLWARYDDPFQVVISIRRFLNTRSPFLIKSERFQSLFFSFTACWTPPLNKPGLLYRLFSNKCFLNLYILALY